MKKRKKGLFAHVLNATTIALIVVCFLYSMMLIHKHAKEDCFERIEETTTQMAQMFNHAMNERLDKLEVFADILAANSENPDELLQTYMENFCKTQYFSAICIHRANGSIAFYGENFHNAGKSVPFAEELDRLPYVSGVFSQGEEAEENFIYQAVPIVRSGKTIAVLYGYTSLDVFPTFIASSAYDGECQFYVVDGSTGDFLMDEYHGILGNIYDGSMGNRETKPGYDMNQMREGVEKGESGYFIFRSQRTGQWYYTYYMPLGINNWSMQLTIDEPTAFQSYTDVSRTVLLLMISVIVLMVIHALVLMSQNARSNRMDRENLHKSDYINQIQRALLNAHNTPEFVDRALKIVAEEMEAETVMLLSFDDYKIGHVYHWPMEDRPQAQALLGRNIKEDFSVLFHILSLKDSVIYDEKDPSLTVSEKAQEIFREMDLRNIALVPIMDTCDGLKGAIAAVNMSGSKNCDMLECVTYDFFMAIANLENHNIIKKMGSMDYLTGIKNRNSYETELGDYRNAAATSLWCVFVDVNGLHEVNNSQGHKAGDKMLCTIADSIKKIFGEDHTYRMGGDEFVSFFMDSCHEEFMHKKYQISEELAEKGYFVSVGFAGGEKGADGTFDVEHIVEEAEAIMYRDKWEYYKKNDIPSERGHFPELLTKE